MFKVKPTAIWKCYSLDVGQWLSLLVPFQYRPLPMWCLHVGLMQPARRCLRRRCSGSALEKKFQYTRADRDEQKEQRTPQCVYSVRCPWYRLSGLTEEKVPHQTGAHRIYSSSRSVLESIRSWSARLNMSVNRLTWAEREFDFQLCRGDCPLSAVSKRELAGRIMYQYLAVMLKGIIEGNL